MQLVNTSAAETKEVQTVTATAPAGGTLAGTFALALDTRPTGGSLQYTGAIPASAAACCGRTSMTAMVEALYNVGAGGVYNVSREAVEIDGGAGPRGKLWAPVPLPPRTIRAVAAAPPRPGTIRAVAATRVDPCPSQARASRGA